MKFRLARNFMFHCHYRVCSLIDYLFISWGPLVFDWFIVGTCHFFLQKWQFSTLWPKLLRFWKKAIHLRSKIILVCVLRNSLGRDRMHDIGSFRLEKNPACGHVFCVIKETSWVKCFENSLVWVNLYMASKVNNFRGLVSWHYYGWNLNLSKTSVRQVRHT